MRQAARKLKSSSGVTMMLALVFFLLCTILAYILLVSSSTTAGRLSGIAENDARYYAVSSAAELFRDGLNNKPVSITLIKETHTTTVTPYTVLNDGTTQKGTSSGEPQENYTVVFSAEDFNECAAVRGESLLTDLALDLAAGTGTVNPLSAWAYGGLTSRQTRLLTVEPKVGSNPDEALNVDAEAVLESDGRLTITLAGKGEGSDSFKLKLFFSADIRKEESKNTVQGEPTVAKNSETSFSETVHTDCTETRKVTVCWTLTGVERVST